MAVTITNLQNDGDGMNVTATLDMAPAGTLSFLASDLPGVAGTVVSHVALGGNQYRLLLRADAVKIRIPYYITARDTLPGPLIQDSVQECEWLCFGTAKDWLFQVEGAVRDILIDNRKALDRALQIAAGAKEWPDGQNIRVQKVLSGLPAFEAGGRWPVISVRINRFTDDPYFFSPESDYTTVTGMVYCYGWHQTGVSHEWIAEALGMAVLNIINRNIHRELELEAGLCLYESLIQNVTSQETWDSDLGHWFSAADCQYSGKLNFLRLQ